MDINQNGQMVDKLECFMFGHVLRCGVTHHPHALFFFGIDMSKDVVPIQIGLFQNVDTQEFMWVRLHHIYLQGAHIPTYESLIPLVIPIN